jgi:uncharacterized protein YprB with RNaseH-like and TPR domain
MENALRKRLEILKGRAREIRRLYLARHGMRIPVEPGEPLTLAEAAAGEEIAADLSRLYLIRMEAGEVVSDAPALAESFALAPADPSWRGFLVGRAGGPRPAVPGAAAASSVSPGFPVSPVSAVSPGSPGSSVSPTSPVSAADFCFFDIETTGLTPSTYVFLCGMMTIRDGRFFIEQAFARDYSEETGMLGYVRDVLERFRVLVTFNGASFDVPFVKTRMAVARIDYAGPLEHVDLLPPARPRFRGVLPDCRLETIERHLRGMSREDDIPGSEIPDAYHEFVRTGDARKIKRILHHNRMDLLAMVGLFNCLMTGQSR